MKNLKNIVIALGLFTAIKINAQHASINSLVVAYKPASAANGGTNLTDLKCTPNATISLNGSANVSKVYFKIINPQNNAVIYNVNYTINSSPVISNGVKLFEVSGNSLTICADQLVTLKPYRFELQTEDNQNNLTTVYSATK